MHPSASADWSANLLGVGSQRYVLLVSEQSRLPVLVPARDLRNLSLHLRSALKEILAGLRLPPTAIERELNEMTDAVIAPTNKRSVLGTIDDFIKASEQFSS